MRSIGITTHIVLLACLAACLWLPEDLQATDTPVAGKKLLGIQLTEPDSIQQQKYLGIDGSGSLTIAQIRTKLVVVEFYSLYCPVCQKQAAVLNKLYKCVENTTDLRKDVKFMAIVMGNSRNEIDVYRKNFHVPFPLFPDPDKKIMQALDIKYIPLTVLMDLNGKILFSHQGLIKDIDGFLSRIKQFRQQY